MIELRPFQDAMIQETRQALRTHPAVLFQLPTGGGKTVVASFLMSSAVARGGRPWFICHRDFLVDQTSKTLSRVGLNHGFIAAGRRWDPYAPAQVCSIDTLRNRLDRVPPECWPTVIFLDEAKHAAAGSWAKVTAWARAKGARVIGLEATPERLDGKGLGDTFGYMVKGPSISWLIEQGYLSTYRAFAPSLPDLSGVSTLAGEYKTDELAEAMDTDKLTGNIVEHYLKLARGMRAICFAVSVKHSRHIVDAFMKNGVRAVHLDADSPTDERKAAARAMADGLLDVISNVGLFGEGYDLAAQAERDVTVECVILARPTQSLAMYMQQVGRALRQKPEAAVILDHAGNISKHGMPCADRDWSLSATKRGKKKKDEPTVPTPRICAECFAQFAPTLRACPNCGAPVPVEARVLDETDDELVELDPKAMAKVRKMQEDNARSVEDLIAVGRARGYKHAEKWAAHKWTHAQRRVEEQAAALRYR